MAEELQHMLDEHEKVVDEYAEARRIRSILEKLSIEDRAEALGIEL